MLLLVHPKGTESAIYSRQVIGVIYHTSCPSRRCSNIRAPLNFVASLLWLRTASSLLGRSLKQHNPMEKLRSAWSLCWLKKKPFSNGKRHMLPVTSSPGGSLQFCFLRSSSKAIALRDVLLRVSVQSVSLF